MSTLLSYYYSKYDELNVPVNYVSEPINTANSVKGTISGINFNENAFIHELECSGNIIAITSVNGKKTSPDYVPKIKNSNRGCKKSKRVHIHLRKKDCYKSFQFQIMFIIRRIYSDRVKEHKLLLFQNGNFTLTGVQPNVSDVIHDIVDELIEFLQPYFNEPIMLKQFFITMRNFKLTIPGWSIDFLNLLPMLLRKSENIVVLNYTILRNFLCLPIFKKASTSPQYMGKWTASVSITDFLEHNLRNYIKSNFDIKLEPYKTIRITMDRLLKILAPIKKYYKLYLTLLKHVRPSVGVKIIEAIVGNFLVHIYDDLYFHEENLIRDFVYTPEKYQGFRLKIFSPNSFKLKKKNPTTTITLFSSGKVNIVGVSHECEKIVLVKWLNMFIHKYKDIILYNKEDLLMNMSDEEPLYEIIS